MVRQLTLITADGFVRRTLHQALDRHTEAVSDRGDRICVELVGDLLELNRATVMANGREITCELQRATAHTRFAYVSSAEFVDCRAPDKWSAGIELGCSSTRSRSGGLARD